MLKVLKRLLWKYFVIKVIQILILSQIVLAQSISDSDSVFQDKIIDDSSFDELKDNNMDFIEVKTQGIIDNGRYEFKERTEFMNKPDFGPDYENKEEMLFGKVFV